MKRSLLLAPSLALSSLPALAQEWPQYGRDGRHVSALTAAVPPLLERWFIARYNGHALTFPNPGGVVAAAGSVYAVGQLDGADALIAADAATGAVRWAAPVPPATYGSNSTPAIDTANGVVLVAVGPQVNAYRTADGSVAWTAPLVTDVVNASPCLTTDRGPANRAFITDFDFSGAGRLYCINIDPFDAAANPHQPGDVVWSVPIGSASGNTPAYDAGRVYVSSAELTAGNPGGVMCFAVSDTAPAAPLWVTPNPIGLDYFSGVSLGPDGTVYAASYGFTGGQLAGDLVALDGATGAILWDAPSNRTDSTPVPLADGRVLLSGGLEGFGSVPSIELFSATGSLLWDSALATWSDDNANGQIDPGEYLRLGGWLFQPAILTQGGSTIALVDDPGDTSPDLMYAISLDGTPGHPGFITGLNHGSGGTPALANVQGSLLVFTTIGTDLLALGAPPCYANCDQSTTAPVLNVLDFSCFLNRFAAGDPYANCDGSTTTPVLNVLDFSCFLNRFAAGCP
jgi:outer membrane protein assembly factor BamB